MPDKPRYLIVTPDFPPDAGGIQLLVHRIASGLKDADVLVVAVDAPGAAEFDARQPFRVVRVPNLPLIRAASLLILNARAIAAALRFRPAAVLCAHIVAAPAAAAIQRTLGISFVQYLYAKEILARPRLASFAVKHASTNVAISNYTAELAQGAGADPRLLKLITPGVDLPELSHPRVVPDDDRPTVVTIARLEDRHKGHDVIARALPLVRASIPNVRWVVLGDGPLRPALERLVESSGLADAVRFEGVVSDAVRDAWLARSSVFAMPSRVAHDGGEGFGIVFLEASAHGVPVVGPNAGGAVDAVSDGRTGELVDATNHIAVASAITRLLTQPERARRMGAEGRRWAESYSWEAAARRVEETLSQASRS